jgi:hypothetical protein
MKAARSSEMFVNFYQTIQRNSPADTAVVLSEYTDLVEATANPYSKNRSLTQNDST